MDINEYIELETLERRSILFKIYIHLKTPFS